ncbi:hypothetical protein [Pelagibacterium xiamenense]|uniref:hypothetical protein n=1 Tax=Pelagibacterium xiamenense TaxID=2901140 RepID=UPI001E5A41F0|nr:hypothetical protein [Pelagibacterium xiamenense]MCD7058810.1 hypothetical protein [Pelagibacterium xiamenense]
MCEPDRTGPANPAQNLWKEQTMTTQIFTPQRLADRAAGLERRIRRRNIIEYAAAAIVVAVSFGAALMAVMAGIETLPDAIIIAGLVVLGMGTLVVVWQLHARTGSPKASNGNQASFRSYRAELVRQRDALRAVWLWYLAPFVPGLLLIYAADLFRPEPNYVLSLSLLAGTLALVIFLCWLNLVAARGIDAEIEVLDADLDR